MIIGNGLIASVFKNSKIDYTNYIIFASGVSNSQETSDDEYNREKDLVIKTINENKNLKIIYFSSILSDTTKNKYFENKLEIEKIIEDISDNYIIFRLPQVIGNNGNPKNLVNYLKNSIINRDEIIINNNIERSLLDVDDLLNIVNYCKDKVNCETLKISGVQKIKLFTLCELIGILLNKKPIVKMVDNIKYDNWHVDNSPIINEIIGTIDSLNYTHTILKKYLS
jgi:nucleoside-diphosphate-sugar epimerase